MAHALFSPMQRKSRGDWPRLTDPVTHVRQAVGFTARVNHKQKNTTEGSPNEALILLSNSLSEMP